MLPQLGFGKQLHPELDEIFIKQPDKAVKEISSVKDLRNNWKNVNTKLNDHFNKVQAEEWFERHTLVSPEDFEKAPNRNKLNLLMGRTVHLASHLGQLVFLKN